MSHQRNVSTKQSSVQSMKCSTTIRIESKLTKVMETKLSEPPIAKSIWVEMQLSTGYVVKNVTDGITQCVLILKINLK